MKTEVLTLARKTPDPMDRLNIMREYLQARVLRSLHESQVFESLAFVGGTALRFLYNLPRYSEDLDFSLESKAGYTPLPWMRKLKRDLTYQGYDASVSWNEKTSVNVAWIGFTGIMKEAGLSGQSVEKLSIKIEIDTNPPVGATLQSTLVNRHTIFALRHYDLPSLMAGKVHALLAARPYVKGRDWYDLLWYRSRRPPEEPNLPLLEAALAQSGIHYDGDWRGALLRRIAELDFNGIANDVEPFLEHHEEARLLTAENLIGLIRA